MTITELLDKVDWSRMSLNSRGRIRDEGATYTSCPIKQVLGGANYDACYTAETAGMTRTDARLVVGAADDFVPEGIDRSVIQQLRADMLARIARAQQLPELLP